MNNRVSVKYDNRYIHILDKETVRNIYDGLGVHWTVRNAVVIGLNNWEDDGIEGYAYTAIDVIDGRIKIGYQSELKNNLTRFDITVLEIPSDYFKVKDEEFIPKDLMDTINSRVKDKRRYKYIRNGVLKANGLDYDELQVDYVVEKVLTTFDFSSSIFINKLNKIYDEESI